jgi:hypothetical protein
MVWRSPTKNFVQSDAAKAVLSGDWLMTGQEAICKPSTTRGGKDARLAALRVADSAAGHVEGVLHCIQALPRDLAAAGHWWTHCIQ